MRAAAKLLLVPMLAIQLAACGTNEQAVEQNGANAAATDIEVLPADESVATTSEELSNGVNDPDVTNLGNQH